MKTKISPATLLLTAICVSTLSSSIYLYTMSLFKSPMLKPELLIEKQYLQKFIENNDQGLQHEKLLAEGYWLRYGNIKNHRYWGINGPMGIRGPRDHYRLHGKREGRIFKPVLPAEDVDKERELAEIYWKRYPKIERSVIWGRNSPLGIHGPRDYQFHRGRFHGKIWGKSTKE